MFNYNKKDKLTILFECNTIMDYAFAKSITDSELLNKLYVFGNNLVVSKLKNVIKIENTNIISTIKNNNIDLFI